MTPTAPLPRQQPRSLRAMALALCALAGLALWPAAGRAAIANGLTRTGAEALYNGNGELFFAVTDQVAKVSYTLDLATTLNEFFIQGQPDAGVQRFWVLDDSYWASFSAEASRANMEWLVMGRDVTGGTAVGGNRWFTTARQGQEGSITTLTSGNLQAVISEGRLGTFYNAVNTTGSHGAVGSISYLSHGASFNRESEGQSYVGGSNWMRPEPADATFGIANRLGQSSWFYYLTRSSSTNQLAPVAVDEFDNLGHDAYWGFTYVEPTLDSPYAGKYLLSYTLPSALVTATQREFANGIGRTEFGGGFSVTRLGAATSTGLEQPTALLQPLRLGVATALPLASPVPEPATAWLAAAGLLALLGRRALRRT